MIMVTANLLVVIWW